MIKHITTILAITSLSLYAHENGKPHKIEKINKKKIIFAYDTNKDGKVTGKEKLKLKADLLKHDFNNDKKISGKEYLTFLKTIKSAHTCGPDCDHKNYNH